DLSEQLFKPGLLALERRLAAVEHIDLVSGRSGIPLEAVDMFEVRDVRKERRRRDADVAHPDDADPPDRAAFLDEGSKVLGHCTHLWFVFMVDILSSATPFVVRQGPERASQGDVPSGETIY